VSHVTIEKTFVRNTGDDGIALWSEEGRLGAAGADHDNVMRFDTVELPILANGVAFYGGRDNSVTDSVVADTLIDGGASTSVAASLARHSPAPRRSRATHSFAPAPTRPRRSRRAARSGSGPTRGPWTGTSS